MLILYCLQQNHDILWKARVKSENKAAGLQHHDNVPSFYQNDEARPSTGVLAATAQRVNVSTLVYVE